MSSDSSNSESEKSSLKSEGESGAASCSSSSGGLDNQSGSAAQASEDHQSGSEAGPGQASEDGDSGHQSGSEAGSAHACSDEAGADESSDHAKSGSSGSSSKSSSKASSVQEKSAFAKETTEEHARRHDYPANLKTCARCQYVHNRTKWESLAVYEHPVTGEKLTYSIETPDASRAPWGLGCSLCRAAGFKSQYALCRAKGRLCNILRHGNVLPDQVVGTMPLTSDHSKALDLWKANLQKQLSVQKSSDTEESGDKKKEAPRTAISCSHVLFNRTLVETGGSFRDLKKWAETARLSGAALPPGADDRCISAQITHCMAEEERLVTSKLLQAASAAALKQDGRGQHVMNTLHFVLWVLAAWSEQNSKWGRLFGSGRFWSVARLTCCSFELPDIRSFCSGKVCCSRGGDCQQLSVRC